MATIVILEHALQAHAGLPYMMRLFVERWCQRGHQVVVHHGAEDPPPGDIAVMHVDLTVIPQAYRRLAAFYPRVINGAVFDISKSRISSDAVTRDSDWRGPVIVKTEANYGGKPEQLLRQIAAQQGVDAGIPAGPTADGYPIYASMDQVPEFAWRTPGIMVERFLPERDENGRYCVRVWTFLGDRERSMRWRSAQPIVKASNVLERDMVPVPDEIRAMRERLGFDFAKFDYVRHEGRWVLLDANKTPSAPDQDSGPIAEAIAQLGDGIESYLRR
jgi:hypothetical protein